MIHSLISDDKIKDLPVFLVTKELIPLLDEIDNDTVIKARQLLRFPFPDTWWEFEGNNVGIVVRDSTKEQIFEPWTLPNNDKSNDPMPPLGRYVFDMSSFRKVDGDNLTMDCKYEENKAQVETFKAFFKTRPEFEGMMPTNDEIAQMNFDILREPVAMITRVLIMLHSKNMVERIDVPAPVKLNKKRAKTGKPPVSKHTRINLNPSLRRELRGSGTTGGKKSLHAVRGHPRVLNSGKVTWITPHMRGGGTEEGSKVYKL